MGQYNFGSGTLVGLRTDVTNTPPVLFGVCKSVDVDFSRKIEKLVGQYQVPIALGAGELDTTVKVNWAKISFSAFNNLFFGQNGSAGTYQMTPLPGVAGTVPGSSTYTVTPTVPNSGTWAEDLGVFYAATGQQLTPVASEETTGQYAVSAGTYTFAAGDASAALLFIFGYTTTAGGTVVTMSNQLMGSAPMFELNCQQQFSQFGVTKILNLKLFACMSSKLSFPFKNTGFTEMSLDVDIQANAAGNWAELSVTDA